jgi:protein-tyrosine phosphatase
MDHIYNFRDFGGYPAQNGKLVRKGLLFRSGDLDQASQNDLEDIAALGVRTVVDLRTPQERSESPDRLPSEWEGRVVHLPMKMLATPKSGRLASLYSIVFGEARKLDFEKIALATYQDYVIQYRDELSKILCIVMQTSNLPILIHCTAGKDRTGVVCSLLQIALGVPGESVMQDYLLSNEWLNEYNRAMLKRLRFLNLLGVSNDRFLPLLEARKEYLQAAIDQIENEYGDFWAYLRVGLGFSEEERLNMMELLLQET